MYHNDVPHIVDFVIQLPPERMTREFLEAYQADSVDLDALELLLADSLQNDVVAPAKPKMDEHELERVAQRQRYCKKISTEQPCAICQHAFRTRQYVRQLPCGHMFCNQCIQQWVTQHNATCPVCRLALK